MEMTFEALSRANEARQAQWAGGEHIDTVFTALEFVEEAGEVAGALKKIVRFDRGISGNKNKSRDQLEQELRDELGDAMINLSRLCNALGLRLDDCVRAKFNQTSRTQGIEVYL